MAYLDSLTAEAAPSSCERRLARDSDEQRSSGAWTCLQKFYCIKFDVVCHVMLALEQDQSLHQEFPFTFHVICASISLCSSVTHDTDTDTLTVPLSIVYLRCLCPLEDI